MTLIKREKAAVSVTIYNTDNLYDQQPLYYTRSPICPGLAEYLRKYFEKKYFRQMLHYIK